LKKRLLNKNPICLKKDSSNLFATFLDTIRGIGYIEASELCPQFVKNLIAFSLITLKQIDENL